jgi:hypothetical protein
MFQALPALRKLLRNFVNFTEKNSRQQDGLIGRYNQSFPPYNPKLVKKYLNFLKNQLVLPENMLCRH